MKKTTIVILSIFLISTLTFSGCDFIQKMFGGGGEQPPMPPTTTTPGAPPTGPGVAPTTPMMPAGPITESGYLSGPGQSYTFTVDAGTTDLLEVTFTYPVGSVDFWVKVVGQDGYTILGDFDLDNGEIIQLINGGIFYLTIYSRMGEGYWSATYNPAATAPGSNCNTSSNSAWGSLTGPGDYCDWSIYSQVNTLTVNFSVPAGSNFWLEVIGEDGYTVLGEFDLNQSPAIDLIGGGTFYLSVYSNYGSGNWSASW